MSLPDRQTKKIWHVRDAKEVTLLSAAINVVVERLELEAREAKKGAWTDSQPVPLWERRKRK